VQGPELNGNRRCNLREQDKRAGKHGRTRTNALRWTLCCWRRYHLSGVCWVIDDRPAAQPAAARVRRMEWNGMTIIQGETLTLIKTRVVRLLVTVSSGRSFLLGSLSLPSQTA
jgi:hypothetical protein